MLQPPRFEFYDPQTPIYTSPRFLPPAKLINCKISDAIVSHGAYLEECTVDNAIIGLRARIDKGCQIRVSSLVPGSCDRVACMLAKRKACGLLLSWS